MNQDIFSVSRQLESNRIIKLAEKGKYFLGRIIRNIIVRKSEPANVVAWKKIADEDSR